jgi:hypothetical protein
MYCRGLVGSSNDCSTRKEAHSAGMENQARPTGRDIELAGSPTGYAHAEWQPKERLPENFSDVYASTTECTEATNRHVLAECHPNSWH